MRIKIVLALGLALVSVLNLAGCATTGRNNTNLKAQQLQVRVNSMEREAKLKDDRIRYLESELRESKKAKSVEVVSIGKKGVTTSKAARIEKIDISDPTPRQVQSALKKAGLYDGPIDGKIGERTTKAIKDFQKANGLVADGIPGKQTWSKLKKYLE